ncbi:MAG: SDR family NAD(P)-dependent oxidoreductase [Anaerolineae bacterium]|jgi:NAD(P)-dependent dehydrogenase (short-subunit alcohol dehydrogenase family)|nr:SDR family NAD(P)-dependent oxidoreductase [Anaerolineae bacterium]MDX9833125.1 SDR family NAD(P)-dependent oxidoreductase [Anaerolineae bacterium]
MELSLQDRVALITGGSSGIGRAAARLFVEHGARVGVLGRTEDEVRRAADELGEGKAIPLVANVADGDQVRRAVETLVDRWDRLDVVFANAGVNGVWAPIDELKPEEWEQTLRVNLTGTFFTIKYSVPYLKRRGGSIIVTSSVNGTRMFSNSGASAYATSKAGQVALTKMLALELAEFGIRANVICPGAIETEIDENTEKRDLEHTGWAADYPEGRVPLTGGGPGKAEDVAHLALFLASDASSLISGTEMWIDGAESLLQG